MENETETNSRKLSIQELQLEEYKLLQSIANNESSLFWTRFNILFAVEIFLFGVFAFIIKELYVTESTEGIFVALDKWVIVVLVCMWIFLGASTTLLWYTITEKNSGFISFILRRMKDVEDELVHIKKQNLYDQTFRQKPEKNGIDTREPFAIELYYKLRETQKFSVTRNIRFIIIIIMVIWLILPSLFFHITFENPYITGFLFLLPVLFLTFLFLFWGKKEMPKKIKEELEKKLNEVQHSNAGHEKSDQQNSNAEE